MKKQEYLTIEQLERKIKYLKNKRIKCLKKLKETETIHYSQSTLIQQTDISIIKSDISNLNAEICIYEQQLRNLQAESQSQPQ